MFEIKPETNLLTAVPSTGLVRIEWALMFSQLVPPTNMTSATKIVLERDVVEARNICAKTALDNECEFLFFLDSDTFCGPQTQRRLHNQMRQSADVDVLTGIVPMKTPDAEPCIYKADQPGAYWDWTFGETFEIDACGMACAMIRTSTLAALDEPWFEWESSHSGNDHSEMGEDVGFCKKVKDAGGKIMADGGVICGHMSKEGTLYQISDQAAPMKRGADKLRLHERAHAASA
jgi:hypothetical protein